MSTMAPTIPVMSVRWTMVGAVGRIRINHGW